MRRSLTLPLLSVSLVGLALSVACSSPSATPVPEVTPMSVDALNTKSGSNLPLPPGAEVNTEQSLMLGAADAWIGRMVFSSDMAMPELVAFYQQRLPELGWQMIHAVQAKESVQTYVKGDRVITLRITPRWIRGCSVMAYVAPTSVAPAKGAATKVY